MIVKFIPDKKRAIIDFEDLKEYATFYTILDNATECDWDITIKKKGDNKNDRIDL
jgi:hypothetical protein